MTGNRAFTIHIFLPGGDPDGLRKIEKSGWSGCGLVIPRTLLAEAKQRKEIERTGVYILLGPPEESGLLRVYIGEGDPIRPRLEDHSRKKDFWTTCIAFTSKDENLNKAHVQYLEARLYALAEQAKRCTLDNDNAPQPPSLSESDEAEAAGFLAEMMLCLPVLGVSVFAVGVAPRRAGVELTIRAKGVVAKGIETPQGLVVRAQSQASATETPTCPASSKELRAALVANGVLKRTGDHYTFAQDYVFTSPSTASAVVLGRSSNGRAEWKTKDGRTLKDVQEAGAAR